MKILFNSIHWHPEFLGAHPYLHCVLISRVFLRTPAPTLPHKKMCKNGQESRFHINSPYVLRFWQIRQFMITNIVWILKKFHKIYRKYYKNGWFWVSLRVVVFLKFEIWVWAVLTLCQYGMRTDTVSVYTRIFCILLKICNLFFVHIFF